MMHGPINIRSNRVLSVKCKSPLLLGAYARLRKATVSFVMSVCPSAWNSSAPTMKSFIRFFIGKFFEKSVEKTEVTLKPGKNYG